MNDMNKIIPQEGDLPIGVEVLVSEEDCTVYVKITGFETPDQTIGYAEHLSDVLPLLLFESEVKH